MRQDIEKLYDDIIDMPHHVSTRHPQMSMMSRAAQFAPFSALHGHNDAINATARSNEYDFDTALDYDPYDDPADLGEN